MNTKAKVLRCPTIGVICASIRTCAVFRAEVRLRLVNCPLIANWSWSLAASVVVATAEELNAHDAEDHQVETHEEDDVCEIGQTQKKRFY